MSSSVESNGSRGTTLEKMLRRGGTLRNSVKIGGTGRQKFPARALYTVSGLVVGRVCFTCRCRVVELSAEEGMILAWCECDLPDDAALMEVL